MISGNESALFRGRSALPRRFTLDGSDVLEADLARTCETVLNGIRGLIPDKRLQGVLLGGGYGRGEGGVMHTSEGDRPYNDLEFYVFLCGNRHLNERRHLLQLTVLGEILSRQAGVEIEFKITSVREFRRSAVSMFSHDLIMGHRRLWGHTGIFFKCTHHRLASAIPLSEATRLLMNRCAGLLFSQERLDRPEFTSADADFVWRNQAKADLAFGDVLLVAYGEYHSSARERHDRLQRLARKELLPLSEEICSRHAAGVKFKLHPCQSTATRDFLRTKQTAIVAVALEVWLWQECRRLRTRFVSANEYYGLQDNKCPETRSLRNALVNLKGEGIGGVFRINLFRHPREKVLRNLSALLWGVHTGSPIQPADNLKTSFPPKAGPLSARIELFRSTWQRVH